ncbi:MAG: FAD-dependent oxidoreductase [Candidatus Eremiobacteraeota bacterium]|nr:FAD-dependent oxidoreductase [Candidatus Eremiobacteraeota bacterium]MCW5871258.1 FAD-dependent oxidoreductase [Candidatus Eremiobacteraeota bacterium]
MKTTVIVGSGFSGLMVAVNLVRQDYAGRVVLVEKRPVVAQGAAYSTAFPGHLLNVPAFGMSAYPDEPDHFKTWAVARGFREDAFVPRCLYGEYLKEQFTARRDRLEVVSAEAVRVETGQLYLDDGQTLAWDHLVLALGNFPPQRLKIPCDSGFYDSSYFQQDPWDSTARPPVQSVLLIGTGLTAVDKVLELAESTREIYAISRHGLRPKAHPNPPLRLSPEQAIRLDPSQGSLSLLRQFRAEVRRTGDWRFTIASLRAATNPIWQGLSEPEKMRFRRHLGSLWDNHRHQIPWEVSDHLSRLQNLHFLAGRLHQFQQVQNRVRVSYAGGQLEVDRVINCTGPSGNLKQVDSPLLADLLHRGLGSLNPSQLGLATNSDFRLLDSDGQASSNIFTLGPLLKGTLGETIAVPEIREQAVRVAAGILCGGDR